MRWAVRVLFVTESINVMMDVYSHWWAAGGRNWSLQIS